MSQQHHENISSPKKSNVESKSSPIKQAKLPFSLNVGSKPKDQSKIFQYQPINVNKSQKEVTTINVDKNKLKSSILDIPVPSNVTAYSYIVYEPSFSQNYNFNSY